MIRLRHFSAAACVLLGASTSTVAQPPSVRTSSAAALERRVDSLFGRAIRRDGPGCAVGVYRNGSVVLTRGYGLANVEDGRPITPRTTFNFGSVSKPFTALAALMLEQRGTLSLDDDVRRWVPELPDYGTPMRVRDLLQHTSGLRDYGALGELMHRPVATMAELLSLLAAQRALNFASGTQHEYSHSDFVLLAIVIERATGAPFGEHLERAVLRPLGMVGSGVDDGRPGVVKQRAHGRIVSSKGARIEVPDDRIVGGGNVYASVEDLARWDRNFEDSKVGGAAIARMLGRPTLPSGDTIPYAFGLRTGRYRGLRTVSRGGHTPGSRAEIIRFPEQRFTVATLCNADHLEAGRLAQGVAELYLGARMRPLPLLAVPSAVVIAPDSLARFAGVYRSREVPWNLLPIEMRNGSLGEVLFDDVRDDTLFTMTPAGNGRFFEVGLTGNVGIFTFRPAAQGAPPQLEISWNGGPAETLERLADSALWRPSAAALAEYEGTWFSDELDAGWRLEARGARLVLHRRGQAGVTLRPVERDLFVRGFGPWMDTQLTARLEFQRDGAGTLTHLIVSTPPGEDSVRGLRFVRLSSR